METDLFISNAGAGRNQAVRSGLALAALTGKSVRLAGVKTEGPRSKPGMSAGHFTALAAAARITDGGFKLEYGGEEAKFLPGPTPLGGEYEFDVSHDRPSPALCSLVLEPLLPALSKAKRDGRVFVSGGTHVPGGFTSDEFGKLYLPNLNRLGLKLEYVEIAPGFLPFGNGEVELRVSPSPGLSALQAEDPFQPQRLGLEILCSGLPVHLAEQAAQGAADRLKLHGFKAQARIRKASGQTGMALLAWAEHNGLRVGFTALGQRGGRPDALAVTACENLVGFLKSGCGITADMAAALLAPLAAARGITRFTVDKASPGLKGAIRAVEAFFPGAITQSQPRGDARLEIKLQGQGLI